jgi:hypothetical protein
VERDKPKRSESVGQTLLQLPWKPKTGDSKKNGFLSSNFMKLCRNIHLGGWHLLGVDQFIFEFLTIYFYFPYFYIGGHFENFKNKEHNFE